MFDDLDRLRRRRDAFAVPGMFLAAGGEPAFVGKVISTGTNLGVGKFFKVNPVSLTGAETEGGAATATVDTGTTQLVYAVGPQAPATNDYVVCRWVNWRWVADKLNAAGGGGSPTPGFGSCCSNALPSTISMTVTFRAGTNSATYSDIYQNTTLTFMATPPAGLPGFLTNRYWSPLLTSASAGFTFYTSLFCLITGNFQLITDCEVGSGCNGGTNVGWLTSTLGNACSPFLLSQIQTVGNGAGFAFPGDNIVIS